MSLADLISSSHKVTQQVIGDDSHRAYTALLSRIERRVDQLRAQVSIDARNILRRELKAITDKGYELSHKLGVEDIDDSADEITELIVSVCDTINKRLNSLCVEAVQRLNTEIHDVLVSDTANYFFSSISTSYSAKKHLFESKESKISRAQFDSLKSLIETATGKTISMATKGGTSSANFLIKTTEASGSTLHTAILNIGKQIGYKFKPWQAAKIAKTIGNVAKVLDPVVSVLGMIFDVKETVDANSRSKAIRKAQLEYRQEFIEIASDLESQYINELQKLFDVYDGIAKQLQASRENVQNMIQAENSMNKCLLEIRKELVGIQTSLF